MENKYQVKIKTARRQSNTNLIKSLKAGVLEEKKLLADCLILLSEIMKRNIHTKSGYSSLHKYCLSILPLSKGAVYRRTQVAGKIHRYPILLDLIGSGKLTLTAASVIVGNIGVNTSDSQIISFVGKTVDEIKDLIGESDRHEAPDSISRTKDRLIEVPVDSSRIGSSEFTSSSQLGSSTPVQNNAEPNSCLDRSETPQKEFIKEKRYVVQFTGSEALNKKLKRAREVLSHKYPNGKCEEIIGEALDALLAKFAPENQKSNNMDKPHNEDSAYIPRKMKRDALKNAGYCCELTTTNGKRCDERSKLEIDHIISRAHGGKTTRSNLQVLCKAHNNGKAKDDMGDNFIENKINSRKSIRLLLKSPRKTGTTRLSKRDQIFPAIKNQQELFPNYG
jgi:5-methylcytosine-specific restriction endonuclease McrA